MQHRKTLMDAAAVAMRKRPMLLQTRPCVAAQVARNAAMGFNGSSMGSIARIGNTNSRALM